MCGIIGLFAKTERYESDLGSLMARMLTTMSDRGPDSAGFSIYRDPIVGHMRVTIRPGEGRDVPRWINEYRPKIHKDHVVLCVPNEQLGQILIDLNHEDIPVVGIGKRMSLYKGIGLPEAVAEDYGLSGMAGSHGIGHTRMATESAVTIDGAHPFNTGPDLSLVHNGSLSNHASVRRNLTRAGMLFETENDSEVAAGYLTHRLKEGDDLKMALTRSLDDLDGFFTFVVSTERGFGVVRDPIACKPAVMCETDDLIGFGSEYRALAELPEVGSAKVWEPEPGTVYFWERND